MYTGGIVDILQYMTIEEALEHLDITEEDCLEALFRHGYITIPPWLEMNDESEKTDD